MVLQPHSLIGMKRTEPSVIQAVRFSSAPQCPRCWSMQLNEPAHLVHMAKAFLMLISGGSITSHHTTVAHVMANQRASLTDVLGCSQLD